jgi:hypothetical protein
MKRCFLLPVIAVMMFAACDEPHDIMVTNNSSNQVAYTMYEKQNTFTISPGEIQSFTKTKTEPVSFSGSPHPVDCNRIDSYSVEFVNAAPIELRVANLWSFDIKLYADGYLESENGDKEPVNISAGAETKAIIYTKNPRFSFDITGYSINTIRKLENNIMYVTIK